MISPISVSHSLSFSIQRILTPDIRSCDIVELRSFLILFNLKKYLSPEQLVTIKHMNNLRPPYNLVFMPLSHCHDCLLCGRLTYTINSIIMSGIAPKQNACKLKFAPHRRKFIVEKAFWQEDRPLANGALFLSTHKHNGTSGTAAYKI